ncbi:MAG: hypothetical protein ACTSYB_03465 [Candidatus Helarchaeota archaeon]
MSGITDVKKFKILRKDLIFGIKRARTLDDIIALLARKIKEYSK